MLQAGTLVSTSNASSLDLAMVVTYNNTRDFMMQACGPMTCLSLSALPSALLTFASKHQRRECAGLRMG